MTGEAGPVPDDVIELLARALHEAEWGPGNFDADLDADMFREEARNLAAVPAVSEVFARDAKVREIVAKWAHLRNEPWPLTVALEVADSTAALFDGGDRP